MFAGASLPIRSYNWRLSRDSTDTQTDDAVRIRRAECRPLEVTQSSCIGRETAESESKVVVESMRAYCGLRRV